MIYEIKISKEINFYLFVIFILKRVTTQLVVNEAWLCFDNLLMSQHSNLGEQWTFHSIPGTNRMAFIQQAQAPDYLRSVSQDYITNCFVCEAFFAEVSLEFAGVRSEYALLTAAEVPSFFNGLNGR